ncbi:MAG: bifunctional precorrin-2 dehydrogenase/sirohydrochlorin ferrochelatase [Nitrospirae bacterium]|nr:MAG: bifunctional precorrin-2 dehydrogenase/sirohydrochlorin ferrochelatase [Nitrospirota bacterium]
MRYYPVFLDISGKLCVVVGGGEVGERKVSSLLEAGGRVRVVSPELTPHLDFLARSGKIEHVKKFYEGRYIEGAFLVIAATSDMEVNRRVYEDARTLPVNVVDVPELCTFIVPSTIRRGDLTVAISTSGVSPALARSIREELEELYPPELEEVLKMLLVVRGAVKSHQWVDESKRTELLKKLGSKDILDSLRKGGLKGAKMYILALLNEYGLPAEPHLF